MAKKQPLPEQITRDKNGRYRRSCPSCGKEQSYLRRNYAIESLRLGKICKACSNKKTDNCNRGWHRGVRISWLNRFRIGAELRRLEWKLTLDDIADLMEEQNNRCALTGLSIEFPEVGHPQNAPASIDRIDSSKGYVRDNIQLVVKRINMMKQQYSQDEVIDMCLQVALTHYNLACP